MLHADVYKRQPISFDTVSELEDIMQNIASQVHREINELNPIVDARLLDGSRVNGVYKNIAIEGPVLTIRKFSDDYMKIEDLERNGTINRKGIISVSYTHLDVYKRQILYPVTPAAAWKTE